MSESSGFDAGSPGLLSSPLRHEVRSPGITTRISALIRGNRNKRRPDGKEMARKMKDWTPASPKVAKKRFVDPKYKGIGLLPKVDLNPSPLPKLTAVRKRNSVPLKIISVNSPVSGQDGNGSKKVSLSNCTVMSRFKVQILVTNMNFTL